jgi:hypothetical protein
MWAAVLFLMLMATKIRTKPDPNPPPSDDDNASHEAGHAVLLDVYGFELIEVSIEPEGEWIGGKTTYKSEHPLILQRRGVFWENRAPRHCYLSHSAMTDLAGNAAQMVFSPESVKGFHSIFDRPFVWDNIKARDRSASQAKLEANIKELYEHTLQFLKLLYPAVEAVKQALLTHRRLSGTQARTLIRSATEALGPWTRLPERECPHCPHCAQAQYEWD